jgi:hypothetical protein
VNPLTNYCATLSLFPQVNSTEQWGVWIIPVGVGQFKFSNFVVGVVTPPCYVRDRVPTQPCFVALKTDGGCHTYGMIPLWFAEPPAEFSG